MNLAFSNEHSGSHHHYKYSAPKNNPSQHAASQTLHSFSSFFLLFMASLFAGREVNFKADLTADSLQVWMRTASQRGGEGLILLQCVFWWHCHTSLSPQGEMHGNNPSSSAHTVTLCSTHSIKLQTVHYTNWWSGWGTVNRICWLSKQIYDLAWCRCSDRCQILPVCCPQDTGYSVHCAATQLWLWHQGHDLTIFCLLNDNTIHQRPKEYCAHIIFPLVMGSTGFSGHYLDK